MDWKALAVALPVGHHRRVNCWVCGGKKTIGIANHGDYLSAHCFKCKHKEGSRPPPMTPQERRAMEKAAEAFVASEPALPTDFTTDIPVKGLLWLSKGGLHVDDIKRFGFGWSEKMRRVIMPVWNTDGTLVAIQARTTEVDIRPKYLGSVWSGPRPVFRAEHAATGPLVLTEDILSACRVSKVCTAWSLLGTNLMDAVIADIADTEYKPILIWMDDDEAGINARRKMKRQLEAVGIETGLIRSDRDPKHHTLEEMRGLIYGTKYAHLHDTY